MNWVSDGHDQKGLENDEHESRMIAELGIQRQKPMKDDKQDRMKPNGYVARTTAINHRSTSGQ